MDINVVILAGGSGSRLWPLSRSSHPKQFLPITSDRTMLQTTVDRVQGLKPNSIVTVSNEEHKFLVAGQLQEIDSLDTIILEPEIKNTAPAIALSAFSPPLNLPRR